MKKLFKTLIALSLVLITIFALTACSTFDGKAVEMTDAEPESYGFAVKKGTNANIITELNKIIDNLGADKIEELVAYYFDVAAEKKNIGACPVTIPDVSKNTGGTLKVGTESGFAPFEFIKGDEVVGADMAIMTLLADALNMKIYIDDMDFDTLPTALATGTIDIIAAGFTATSDRKTAMDFSKDYYTSIQYIVCAADADYEVLADLSGLKIGVQKATTGSFLIEDAIADGTLSSSTKLEEYKSGYVAYQDLKAGRIDVIVIDKLPAQVLVK